MLKSSDGTIGLVALVAFAVWLFVGLPLLYLPSQDHVHGEFLGVKYGEWLLFLATAGLAWATWQLVKGAEKTAERQLRAYVFVDGGSFTLMTTDQGRFFIQGVIIIKNFGQTPGYKLVSCTHMDIFETKFPIFREDVKGFGESVIGPGSKRQIPVVKGSIDAADLQAIRNKTKSIFIWGRIDYVDAFGQPRYLKFYNMNGREMLQPGTGPSGRWPVDQADKPYEAN